jgi:ammonium transporter
MVRLQPRIDAFRSEHRHRARRGDDDARGKRRSSERAAVLVAMVQKDRTRSMTMNGTLAGLVAITAPCAVVSPGASIAIGLIAGVLVVLSVEFIDKTLHIDDPVGAVSVHMVNGMFGTLAVGVWGNVDGVAVGLLHGGGLHQLGVQALGVVSVGAWAGLMSLLLFTLIKATVGLRVSVKEEMMGLDLVEHKSEAYSGFQIFSNM